MAFDVWSVVDPNALDVIHAHVMSSRDVEVGGFLVGTHGDEREPPRCVAAIEAHAAVGDLTRLTFTHEAWQHVHRELELRYAECSIIGWYHSHPGHGIFLSEHDQFIHRNFFSAPWQIAVVVDPVHATEGLFLWTSGEITLASERDVGGAAAAVPQAPDDEQGTAFTGRGTIGPVVKRERLVVEPDEPPPTVIAEAQQVLASPGAAQPPKATIVASPAALHPARATTRDAIVLLREADSDPPPALSHHAPKPIDLQTQSGQLPARTGARERPAPTRLRVPPAGRRRRADGTRGLVRDLLSTDQRRGYLGLRSDLRLDAVDRRPERTRASARAAGRCRSPARSEKLWNSCHSETSVTSS